MSGSNDISCLYCKMQNGPKHRKYSLNHSVRVPHCWLVPDDESKHESIFLKKKKAFLFFACAPKCSDTLTGRYLEVASVALPERQDEPLEDQLPDLRELGVDDGCEGGVNVSEDGRCCLSLQDGASQQTPDGEAVEMLG